jgi:hypothetical protein
MLNILVTQMMPPQLSQLRWKVDEVAAKENRWQQAQNQERNQGRGL